MAAPAALVRATFPAPVLDVLRTLGGAGHRSWLVGGAVRDLLLERPRTATDFDVATPARPEAVQRLFPKVIPTGIEHGTVTVLSRGEPVEVTTFRGEGAYRDGRRPESVTFLQDLEEDLARRDFTMNALAYDPLAREFRDPFGGQADLARRRVRAVGDPAARFGEDGLRAMRGVRFVAQLGFELEPATLAAIPGALEVVKRVAMERITDELGKLLVAPQAERGVQLLHETGLLGVAVPRLAAIPADELRHAALVAGGAPAVLAVRLAALLHWLGPEEAASALFALRLARQTSEAAAALVRFFPCRRRGPGLPATDPVSLRRWLSRVEPLRVEPLLGLAAAEARGVGQAQRKQAEEDAQRKRAEQEVQALGERIAEVLRGSPPLSIRDLALDGLEVAEALGGPPGPRVGEALRHLLDRVLEDPTQNEAQRLRAALLDWSAKGSGRI
jgi:tRNA nucleotidyltransferase (CCA-adding enzyme)